MARNLKTIFNEAESAELLQRLENLHANSKALWGKMDVAQMLAHCNRGMQVPLGEFAYKPSRLYLLGRLMKRYILGKRHFEKNSFTPRVYRITDMRNFETEKNIFKNALQKLSQGEPAVVYHKHPVMGRMKPREWGRLNYKHIDHHFLQFGI